MATTLQADRCPAASFANSAALGISKRGKLGEIFLDEGAGIIELVKNTLTFYAQGRPEKNR
jgi:hypothetical protein